VRLCGCSPAAYRIKLEKLKKTQNTTFVVLSLLRLAFKIISCCLPRQHRKLHQSQLFNCKIAQLHSTPIFKDINMKFAQATQRNMKHIGTALAICMSTIVSHQAHAWCVQDGTGRDNGVVITAASDQFPQALIGTTSGTTKGGTAKSAVLEKVLKPGEKLCSADIKADTQTTVALSLAIQPGKFDCPSNSTAPCIKACSNDPNGVKLLGKVNLIVNAAKAADPQGAWKKGDLVVDYVYNDDTIPDRYSFACKDKASAKTIPVKP
jgi:hypothetical protein